MARHCAAFDDAVAAADVSAMIQANWNLHQAIRAAAGNRYIERYYEQLLTDGLRIANLPLGHHFYGDARDCAPHTRTIKKEHRQILAVIWTRDAVNAYTWAPSHHLLAHPRATDLHPLYFPGPVALSTNAE